MVREFLICSLVLVVAGLSFGCDPKGDDSAGDTDADADTDADSDADADTDADSDSDADTDAGPCPSYSGFGHTGGVWTWSVTDEYAGKTGMSSTWTSALATGASANDFVLTIDVVQSGSGYESDSTTTNTYRCDASGLWYLGFHTDYVTTYGTTEYKGWAEITYDSPALVLPTGIGPSSSWDYEFAGAMKTNTGAVPFSESTVHCEIMGSESVTVPAGTFDTLKMDATTTAESESVTGTSWIDADLGSVATKTSELVSFTE